MPVVYDKERRQSVAKEIRAIIREDALQAVKDGLRDIGIVGMNIFDIRGHGRQGGVDQSWRVSNTRMDLLPKIQVNIVLSEHNVEKTIQTIIKAARTGKERSSQARINSGVQPASRPRTNIYRGNR